MRSVRNTSHHYSVIKPFLIVGAVLALGAGLASAASMFVDPSRGLNAQPPRRGS